MALLNEQKSYIRLLDKGYTEIYYSEEDRVNLKKSTPYKDILKKYEEMCKKNQNILKEKLDFKGINLDDFKSEEEFDNFIKSDNELKILFDNLQAWYKENSDYSYAIESHCYDYLNQDSFPLMSEYYSDVYESIPKNISYMICHELSDSPNIETSYGKAKELKIFGETTDC